jgi:hypothetical protein
MVICESKKKIVIDNYFKKECDVNTSIKEAFIKGFELGLKKAPITPQESKLGQWIPVSESLPNDRDWYLGIFKEPDTGWINPLPFICDYVESETKATTKEHWILRGFTDRNERIDYYFNLECVAWMPLPKAYEPQESEKINCETTKCENCQNHNYCDFEPHKSEG